MPHFGFLREFGREVLAGLAAEALRSMSKTMGEKGPIFVGERLKRAVAEKREEVVPFIEHDLRDRGGEYATAADNLLRAQRLRRSEPYKPGDENHLMNSLALIYGAYDPPPRPPRPDLPTGKGFEKIAERLLDLHERELEERNEEARKRVEEKIEVFKTLGLLSIEDLDALVEAVRDDGLYQLLIARPIFEAKRGVKASWDKVDVSANKAAPHVGRLADWLERHAERLEADEAERK